MRQPAGFRPAGFLLGFFAFPLRPPSQRPFAGWHFGWSPKFALPRREGGIPARAKVSRPVSKTAEQAAGPGSPAIVNSKLGRITPSLRGSTSVCLRTRQCVNARSHGDASETGKPARPCRNTPSLRGRARIGDQPIRQPVNARSAGGAAKPTKGTPRDHQPSSTGGRVELCPSRLRRHGLSARLHAGRGDCRARDRRARAGLFGQPRQGAHRADQDPAGHGRHGPKTRRKECR